jgi:hypothetical protein
MMDTSITLVTPAMHRRRGADAFDRGEGVNDHNMNDGAPAIAAWQAGWRDRQAVAFARAVVGSVLAQAAGCPP